MCLIMDDHYRTPIKRCRACLFTWLCLDWGVWGWTVEQKYDVSAYFQVVVQVRLVSWQLQ